MVSNARLDLPEPERPVITMSWSRGISSEMFFKLCTRAPLTAIVVRGAAFAAGRPCGLAAISFRLPGQVEERKLLHQRVALPGELNGRRGLPDQALVGQILAGRGHSLDAEVPRKVILDVGGRACLADLAQVFEHRCEQRRRPR